MKDPWLTGELKCNIQNASFKMLYFIFLAALFIYLKEELLNTLPVFSMFNISLTFLEFNIKYPVEAGCSSTLSN